MKTHLQEEREEKGGVEEALGQARPWELGLGGREAAFLKSKPTRFLFGMMSKFWKQTVVVVARCGECT